MISLLLLLLLLFSFPPAFVLEPIILVVELCSKTSARSRFALRVQAIKFVWVNDEKHLSSIPTHIRAVLRVGVFVNRPCRFLPFRKARVR